MLSRRARRGWAIGVIALITAASGVIVATVMAETLPKKTRLANRQEKKQS